MATYASLSRTPTDRPDVADNAALTAAALTVAAGTPSTTTTTDVGGAFNQTTLNNQIATVATLANKNTADILSLSTKFRLLLDALESLGVIDNA